MADDIDNNEPTSLWPVINIDVICLSSSLCRPIGLHYAIFARCVKYDGFRARTNGGGAVQRGIRVVKVSQS